MINRIVSAVGIIAGIAVAIISAVLLKIWAATTIALFILVVAMAYVLKPLEIAYSIAVVVIIVIAGLLSGHYIVALIAAAEYLAVTGYFKLEEKFL